MICQSPIYISMLAYQRIKIINYLSSAIFILIIDLIIPIIIQWVEYPVSGWWGLYCGVKDPKSLFISSGIASYIHISYIIPLLIINLITYNPIRYLAVLIICTIVSFCKEWSNSLNGFRTFLRRGIKHIVKYIVPSWHICIQKFRMSLIVSV